MSTNAVRGLLAGIAATATLALAGCTIPVADQGTVSETTAPAPASATGTAAPAPMPDGFSSAFDAFAAGLTGTAGIAVGPVGGGDVQVAGAWTGGSAWSTIKVPLAIAAQETSGGGLSDAAYNAITASDNESAEQLWSALGDPEDAALAVEGVLQRFGDPATVVPSTRERQEYSIFGQTDWSLADQARFGAALPCRGEAAEAYALMGQISSDQLWGLGVIPNAHFKGGWGPGPSGGYLARQLGVIDTPTGRLAVAIGAETQGSFEDGVALLDEVAAWISANPTLLPAGGSC